MVKDKLMPLTTRVEDDSEDFITYKEVNGKAMPTRHRSKDKHRNGEAILGATCQGIMSDLNEHNVGSKQSRKRRRKGRQNSSHDFEDFLSFREVLGSAPHQPLGDEKMLSGANAGIMDNSQEHKKGRHQVHMESEERVRSASPGYVTKTQNRRVGLTLCRDSLTAAPDMILLHEDNDEDEEWWEQEERLGVREKKLERHELFKIEGFKGLRRAKGKRLISNARR